MSLNEASDKLGWNRGRLNRPEASRRRSCATWRGFENDAARISVFMPLVLPGLPQIPAYAEALLAAGSTRPQWRERVLAARLRRQQTLDRTDGTAPRLTAVVTEASLLCQRGGKQDRRAQVGHLGQ